MTHSSLQHTAQLLSEHHSMDRDRIGEILDTFVVFCNMATNNRKGKGLHICLQKPVKDRTRMKYEKGDHPDLATYDSITVNGTACNVDSESFDDVRKIGKIDHKS